MREHEVLKFDTMAELQVTLKKELEYLQKQSDEYSKLIGEKLRENQSSSPGEFDDIKTVLEGPKDPKKKPTKKKESTQWKQFQAVEIYDGICLKGELEIHFQGLEALKIKLEKVRKISDSIDALLSQGLKKDLGCLVLLTGDSFKMTFLRGGQKKSRFAYKSIFTVEAEKFIEIKI